jgi:hypothetical protein
MKKQLIAAAVAASMSAVAMADISITGDAKFEYDNTDTAGTSSNSTATEYHLNVTGKSGDTTVVMKFELDGDGAGSMDLEDNYISTKVGDISVTAGNMASGTGGLLGEIDNGSRERKATLGSKMGNIDVYAGSTTASATRGDANTTINNNMYAGVKFNVAGNAIELKKNSDTKDSFGIKGSVSGINYRYEAKDEDSTGDASYVAVDTSVAGLTIGYAVLDADAASQLTEDDSSEFAVSVAGKQGVIGSTTTAEFYNGTSTATATGQKQFRIGTTVDGTSVTLKSGTIEKGLNATTDLDYSQIQASRKLSSGATLVVTYNDRDYVAEGKSTVTSEENVEVELNVKF